jgi:hypothetical protein
MTNGRVLTIVVLLLAAGFAGGYCVKPSANLSNRFQQIPDSGYAFDTKTGQVCETVNVRPGWYDGDELHASCYSLYRWDH